MAVDIEGFDIVFSSANANHAREIDQSIARMSEKVPTLSMGISEMAKALDALGKINVDGVKKNLDAVRDSIESIDGSKLNKVFELATAKSEGLLNSVTALVNMLGKVDMSSFRGGGKVEVYDKRSRVTTYKDTGGESQNQEQINALIRQREAEMQRLLELQNAINQAYAKQLDTEERLRSVASDNVKEVSSIEQINSSLENKKAKIGEIEYAQRRYNESVSEEAQLQKKIDALRKEVSTSSESMKKADRLRQELKIEEEVWGNAEKILSTERERNVVTAEYEAIKKRQADSEAARMKHLEATMKKYQAEYDNFAAYEQEAFGGQGRLLSQYWQDAIQQDKKGVIAFLKAREEYQRRIDANKPEIGLDRSSYVAPSADGYLNELDAINKKIKEVKEQYNETVKDLDKLNQAEEIAFHAQNRDAQLKELEAKKAIIKQLTEEYGEVARAKERAESVPEVSKSELDSAKKQQSLKQELETLDAKIGKVDELRQKEKTLADAEETLMSAIRDKKRYEEQLGTDKGESRLAALRAEHEELTKHKADIEAKAAAEQKLNEQLDAEKKASEQAKQAFNQAGGEKRLAELKAETAELEKQKSLASQVVMPSSGTMTVSNEKEQQVRENINLLKKEEESLMQRRIELQNIINAADSKGADIQQRTNEIIERQNRTQQQSVVATNETFKALELVIQEYKKAENELGKMSGKLNIAYPEDGFDLENSVQAMKNRLQNLMSELQAAVNSEENSTGILSGIKFPTEQLRADFEALLKELRGEASAYFGNIFDNEKTKVGRGYGNTEKSVEIIDSKTESDTRAWLVDAENRLERLYGLLEAIRANGNQSFFVGLQYDITNISALSERINMLDAQIEAIEHIDKELPTTGDYGDELTHRLEQLRNMRELIEHIKDAQSDDTTDSGESLFVMNENQLKELLEKQKQAVIEAEREVQKQVGTDREEAAKRELENRKKILSDTQLAVDSMGLLGDKNEQKNAENLLETHKRIKEQIEQRIDSINKEIAALEKEADALSVQGVAPTSDDVTIALEKERQLEQDIARFKQEAIDLDVKHKELLERIVSLKEKQGSLMDMSKTKNEFQDIRTLQELIIKESKKIGVEGIGGQFQFSDSQRRQLEEQIAKIFKTSTIEAEKMIRGAVMGDGDLMSGVWGKQNDKFFANFQINEDNIKRLQQERKQVTQELTQVEQQNEQAVLAKQSAERSAIATEEQLIKARENRLKIEKELAKQQPKQSEPKATPTPSPSQGSVIQVRVDDKTILSEMKNISDRLATLFKDIPVSLKKELDLTFFAEKANELKKMFDGITVTVIQQTSVKKTDSTVSQPKLDAGISQFSTDSALIIEAAFERMNNLTNVLIEKIRSIGTAENELFSNLRTDIQGVSTSLQGLVEQLSKVQEKSTRKKSAKKDDDAIVTEREVALTKEELARLDDLNAKLAKSNDLLAKKRAEQDAIVKASGTRDMFLDEEISRLETEIKAYNKAKQDLLVPKHGVAPSQSVVETQQAENAQLKLVKEVEEEANVRQKNIAYLTQMIRLIERMLKYGNFGQGVDMFSGMQQYLVDVQAKFKSLLKEQRTTTEQQIAQQNKSTEDMALSYLKMVNEQIEAVKRKEREEQAYRERVLSAERAFYQERQKLYESLFAKGGKQDQQTTPSQSQINELNYTATEKKSPMQQQLRDIIAEIEALDGKIAQVSSHTGLYEQKNRDEYDKTAAKIRENEQLMEMARKSIAEYKAQMQTTSDEQQLQVLQSGIKSYEKYISQIKEQNELLTKKLSDIEIVDKNARQAVISSLQQKAIDKQNLYDDVAQSIARVDAENEQMIAHLKRVEEIKSAIKGLVEEYNKLVVAGKAVNESGKNSQAAIDIINRKQALEQELAMRQRTLDEAQKIAKAEELTSAQIKQLENEYARLLVQIDKVNAARREMGEKQAVAQQENDTNLFDQTSSGIQAADNELRRLYERKIQLENETQLQLDKIRDTYERKRGEQSVKDFEKAEKNRIAAREASEKAEEQIYQNNKKRLYDLYQEQLKLKGKIGSLDNQRTIVSERSQGTITALSPKQEQLAQEYAQQLAKVNAEISRTASLVGYVDAQNAKESTRIALLEQEIKLQKELDKALEKIYAEQQKKTDAPNSGLSASQIKSMENEYARLLVQIDKVNAARREMNEKQGVAWSTGNMQAFAQISSGIQAAENELNRLNERKAQLENESQLQLDKIRDTHERKRGEQAVKDFERAEKEKTQIAEREAKKRADEEKKKIQGYKSQNLEQNTSLVGAAEFAKTANTINRLQTALKYLQEALSKTKPNTPEWNEANRVYQETKKRLDEIKKSMDGFKGQTNSIIPILKNFAMQIGLVFSVQQLNQWVTHMAKVRAQFELQNIALRSIIQNKEKADQIFAEVQQLALKSPFSIMDLNKFTKQMAAYGVEADKLVGTTKQLADVSAGLGVDMSRLILAYGQVKTANYLRATEVRQFTEAGLNITQELANYFTELSGKMVTAGEVTEMITKRMVKFEDVAEVFKRITSAGGMFYEMQEKQSEGLEGQMQRIGDAYSIMLNDIGKSNQGTIAGVLSTLRELIKNWRVVAEYIKMAAGAYLLYESYVHRGVIIKAVTSLADAWKLIPKYIKASTVAEFIHTDAIGKQAMMLTGLGKLWSGATTAVRAFGIAMKAALNATIIGIIVYGISELINYFVEAKAKADQLKESLDNIDKEVGKEFDQSAASFERLARAITDSSKTFDERNEAMSELKRTFKDILPDEYLQLSYIEQHAGHWDEAEKAMKQYYDSLALEKEKAAIKEANESDLNEAREKIAKHANAKLGEDFGISRGQLESFVDNVLQEMLDGSITTTKQAVDEYIRQIENWNDKTLSKDMRGKIESDLTSTNFFADDNFNDLLETAQKMRKEYDELDESQSHYANAYEKAQAEADAMMKTQADGVKNLIDRTKSGLDQINAIQSQLAQVDLEEQNEETQARKMQLQSQLNEAIQQERDLYEAIGIEMPESFEQVSATTIDIREETARAAEEIIKMFGDGVNPAVVDLYQSYQQLERVQSQLNDGTQRSQEEVARLREIEARSIDDIKARYRKMGVEVQGNIKGIASSQDTIRKEMIRVCNATREYFKKGLTDKLLGQIQKLGIAVEKFLSGLGIKVELVDRKKLKDDMNKSVGDLSDLLKDATADVQPVLKANGQLIKNTLKINDKILKSAKGKLELQPGQNVDEYVKSLKTMYEENEKFISKFDKAKDKKELLKRWGKSDAEIQQLREQAKAAKEIAEAYDPTIFESKKTRSRSRKGTDNTEEIARKRFEFIKRANTEYEKLLKNYDAETAKAKILADMIGEARTLGVDKQFAKDLFTKASTLDTLQEVYDTFYKGIVAKYPKIAMDFQKTFNGIAIEIDVRLREEDRNNIKKQMDELMGGYELAIELDKSGVDRDIVSQLFGVETFDLSDVTDGIEKAWLDALNARAERAAKFAKTEFKAYKSLEEAKAAMGEEDVKLFESQQKKISDTFAKELRAREKEYAKYLKKSYSESVNEQVSAYRQLRQLQMDADFKREAIIGNDKLDDKAKQTALQQIDAQSSQIAAKMQEKLQEKLNKIQWEGFKDSPLFETVLSDIENLSTRSIDMLLSKLEELKITFKDLDPKSIKEITKYIDQLTAQKITKNPFKEWGKAMREIHKLRKEGLTLDKLNAKLISDSDELTRINAEIESYNKVLAIKQQMTHVTDKDTELMKTNTQTLKRLLTLLEGQKKQKSGAGVGTDGSEESKALDLQIEKIQEILAARRTILASNGDNLVLSAQELALLKQQSGELTKQVSSLSKNKSNKQGEINTTKGQINLWDNLSEAQQKSIAILNEVGTAASAGFSVAEEAMNLFGDSSDEVTDAMKQGFDDCIQSCLSLASAIIIMGKASNTALGVIGIIAASLTAVAAVFKTIFNVHEARLEKSIKEHQRQLKKLEAEYDNLSDAISNAFSGFQLGTNTEASIQNLKKQNEQYRAMIEAEKRKKKSDKDKIADWQQTIEDNYKKMQELRQEYLTELGGLGSGSDVRDAAEGFVEAWSEAFGDTRDGISGLKEEFDDFMKNIVKKQAYMKIADHWINKFGDMINASFDKYGQVDYEKLLQAMQWFTEEAIPQMDNALEDMNAFWERLGINWTGTTSNLSGLAAGIQGVTEETAQILEALLNSMRFYVADTNEQLRQIFVTMTNPNDENPFLKELKNQTKYLASIDKRLDSVISATKRASGSHINVFTT